jgi:septal ring factor EnvC (AmiA/AmiB activator)
MTEEQMKAKIAELEGLVKAKDTTISSLESQRSNQNAYITKLEQKNQTLETNMNNVKATVNNQKEFPPEVVEYFQKKRREDYTEQAYAQVRNSIDEETFNLIKPEVDTFLNTYMNESNVSVKYIIDAFHLVLGKAYANPSHVINQKKNIATQVAQPANPVNPTAIAEQVARMQNPGMTNEDLQMTTPTPVAKPTVANTKDAMASFKARLLNGFDSTKFE